MNTEVNGKAERGRETMKTGEARQESTKRGLLLEESKTKTVGPMAAQWDEIEKLADRKECMSRTKSAWILSKLLSVLVLWAVVPSAKADFAAVGPTVPVHGDALRDQNVNPASGGDRLLLRFLAIHSERSPHSAIKRPHGNSRVTNDMNPASIEGLR